MLVVCYLSVFLARVYLWGTGVGSCWYVYLCSLHTFVCVVPLCVCLGVCTHVFELRQKWWELYAAKARWWVPAGKLATLLFLPGTPWLGCFFGFRGTSSESAMRRGCRPLQRFWLQHQKPIPYVHSLLCFIHGATFPNHCATLITYFSLNRWVEKEDNHTPTGKVFRKRSGQSDLRL